MSPWLIIVLFGLIKLPLAAMMLLLPFRNDPAMIPVDAPSESSSDEDGGTLTPPHAPHRPRPRWPVSGRPVGPANARGRTEPQPHFRRRGDHGTPLPSAPLRVRTVLPPRRTLPISR